MPAAVKTKYTALLAREILRVKPSPGTMPADMRVIKQVLARRFGDQKFMQGLVNDFLANKGVTIRLR